jgi:hypothetical protein
MVKSHLTRKLLSNAIMIGLVLISSMTSAEAAKKAKATSRATASFESVKLRVGETTIVIGDKSKSSEERLRAVELAVIQLYKVQGIVPDRDVQKCEFSVLNEKFIADGPTDTIARNRAIDLCKEKFSELICTKENIPCNPL